MTTYDVSRRWHTVRRRWVRAVAARLTPAQCEAIMDRRYYRYAVLRDSGAAVPELARAYNRYLHALDAFIDVRRFGLYFQ